jgi:ATP-binding cassette subfamily B multidrug efflux pump
VLQDISLIARPGTTTAVIGSTGSGKSTLVALICRLYDVTAGAVRVEGIDVRDRDIDELWSTIGLVPQRGYLFSGTIAENLRYGKADATEDEMWDALRIAAADEFARAVIRRPAIYIFDDAVSALDVHTDALVRSRLAEVAADATVIVVAQRISTIVDADQVIVVEDGRVLGFGTHESLLAQSPTYREFAESQSLDAEVSGPR